MKKIIMIIIVVTILSGCSLLKNYNNPFINADETTQLEFGLSKEKVTEILGQPWYVESGENDEIVWIYIVRTISVLSNKVSTTEIIPNKTHSQTKHNEEHHRLAIIFKDGKLIKWERIVVEKQSQKEEKLSIYKMIEGGKK